MSLTKLSNFNSVLLAAVDFVPNVLVSLIQSYDIRSYSVPNLLQFQIESNKLDKLVQTTVFEFHQYFPDFSWHSLDNFIQPSLGPIQYFKFNSVNVCLKSTIKVTWGTQSWILQNTWIQSWDGRVNGDNNFYQLHFRSNDQAVRLICVFRRIYPSNADPHNDQLITSCLCLLKDKIRNLRLAQTVTEICQKEEQLEILHRQYYDFI